MKIEKLGLSCRICLATTLISLVTCGLFGKDYYVRPDGDDSRSGTQVEPWRTLAPVSQTHLKPGDSVFLQEGAVLQGPLHLHGIHRGTAESPISILSTGNEKATIDGGDGPAISLEGAEFITVKNLRLVGSGRKGGNRASGLSISEAEGIRVTDVESKGFQKSGVAISGSRNIRITRVHARNNGFAGISSGGRISQDIYVGYCLAENNPGDPTILDNHSGNGIVLGRVEGALIEYCEARYNGWDMPRKGNGPVGIWVWHADRAVIQCCISHHNRSTGTDGGGFDLDGGVTNSILQYNYSHNNHGAGYLICQFHGAASFRKNTVRYNISQDDGLTNHDAGIYVWVGGAGMESTDVYNNTVFNSKGSGVAFGIDPRFANQLPRITFRNNIFVTGEDQIAGGSEKGRFEGNIYWAMGDGGFKVDGYTDFKEWVAATGQETLNGRIVGRYVDPELRKEGTGLISDPLRLHELTEYSLAEGSPAIDSGLDLRIIYRIDIGHRDFYGTPLPQGSAIDVGACEMPRNIYMLLAVRCGTLHSESSSR